MTTTPDTRLRRLPELGSHDFDQAAAVIDAARICHVGICVEGQPYVLPMACARDGRRLLLHGSVASRLMRHGGEGLALCVTITHLDGLVLARSAFNSSMNYRCVMVFGTASALTDEAEKAAALERLTDHLMPGRRAELRPSTRKEINATTVLALPIETFSVKVSEGPPEDPERDLDQPVWAGVLPLTLTAGEPIPAPDLTEGLEAPPYMAGWAARWPGSSGDDG
jgi:nitroimidazol reductase NimA-like FMN-containing flavoprotein (pyridoxamine 5'-phosphate oxidase superfamily)